jgi:hypothetical protein
VSRYSVVIEWRIDLGAEDFEKLRSHIAKQWGPVALGNEVNQVRIVFKYGFDVVASPYDFRQLPKRVGKSSVKWEFSPRPMFFAESPDRRCREAKVS